MIRMSRSDNLSFDYRLNARLHPSHPAVVQAPSYDHITSLHDKLSSRTGNLWLKPEAIGKSASGTRRQCQRLSTKYKRRSDLRDKSSNTLAAMPYRQVKTKVVLWRRLFELNAFFFIRIMRKRLTLNVFSPTSDDKSWLGKFSASMKQTYSWSPQHTQPHTPAHPFHLESSDQERE